MRQDRLLQADAYSGYGKLYEPGRTLGPIVEAACWVHARRPFLKLADVEQSGRRRARGKPEGAISPIALEAVRRIDALFEIERAINGQSAEHRRAVRQELSAPLVADLDAWMREQRPKLSRGTDLTQAMDYMLKRWSSFSRFLDDRRVCLSNNAAERALRGIALGRKSWLFAGSDRGGQRAAAMHSLIVTTKMNDVDPQAWLADVLGRIAEHPVQRLTSFSRGTGNLTQSPAARPPEHNYRNGNPPPLHTSDIALAAILIGRILRNREEVQHFEELRSPRPWSRAAQDNPGIHRG